MTIEKTKQFLVHQEIVQTYINANRGSFRYDVAEGKHNVTTAIRDMYPNMDLDAIIPVEPQIQRRVSSRLPKWAAAPKAPVDGFCDHGPIIKSLENEISKLKN